MHREKPDTADSLPTEDERPGASILVVDDEESLRYTFRRFLSEAGHTVETARDYGEAMELISRGPVDLIVADIILGTKTGIDLLREVKSRGLSCPVIMVTGYPNLSTATDAVRLGAFDYVPKPVTQEKLLHVAGLALRQQRLVEEKERYRSHLEIIFRSVKDAIITVDSKMRVIELNASAQHLCCVKRARAVGKDFRTISTGCDKQCVKVLERTLASQKTTEVYRTECHMGGDRRHVVSLTATPMSDHGAPCGAVLFVHDETRVNDLERSLEARKRFVDIVGVSRGMQKVYSLIEDLADIDTTVLIAGESGTGKELVAEALHFKGSRNNRPLVKVNCSALSESILESELFGHVRGAFTGAIADRMGRFERADGGTIFLDEIGDISPKLQLQLLRVIQEKEFERVGGTSPIRVNVRVVAATNRDLREKVARGTFREDLYYRLKVVELNLPPLRDRREDIPLLVEHFLKEYSDKFHKDIDGVSTNVERMLIEFDWPGNVRQLKHVIEHACIMSRESFVAESCLPDDFREMAGGPTQPVPNPQAPGHATRAMVIEALERTDGNKAKAARLIGVSRQTLYRKIQEHGIQEHGGKEI